ncbi:MAG: hypothetical protein KJO08_06580 [Gammaproteobacteria bacterium]|nr:hypothetical protein [Gammaproteobacteria bacterium]NNJ84312.1 hypothetical protein [Gammaproteobacteria bacterium]
MHAYRIETTVNETGTVGLGSLPFLPGDEVDVIVLKRETTGAVQPSVFLSC